MIITFCGHSQFIKKEEHEQRILKFFEDKIGDNPADLYLGGYGNFDKFAYYCGKKYKATHPKVSLIFVTPYLNVKNEYQQSVCKKNMYDLIIYPEIEDKPLKFAISYRNKYMVEKADYVIAYIDHEWGGAYQTYKHAKRKHKEILNLANWQ